MAEQTPPRLVVDLPQEVHEELNRLIPWGVKTLIFRKLCVDLIILLRRDPEAVVGAIMSGELNLSDFPSFKRASDG